MAKEQENSANSSDVFNDNIDSLVEENVHSSIYKNCYSCGQKNIPKSKVNCPNCKQNINKSKLELMGTLKCIYEEPVSQSKTMNDNPVFLKSFCIELKKRKWDPLQ